MVTRDRIQGETLQLLIIPSSVDVASAFVVLKGPNANIVPATIQAVLADTIIGYPWMVGSSGWLFTDFGPTPPLTSVFLATADTTNFDPGLWAAEIWTQDSAGAKFVLTTVSFSVNKSLANGGVADVRSTAAKAVAAIEAYMADPKNVQSASYKINNRELTRYSISELRELLRYWKQQLKNENIRARGKVGVMGRRIEVML